MIRINSDSYLNGLVLFLKVNGKKIGVIADTHIGFVRSLNKRGIMIEDNQADTIIRTLKSSIKIQKNKKLDSFVIDGDFFHEFSKIDDSVIRSAKEIIRFILETISDELVIIKGNHDKIIAQLFHELKVGDKVTLKDSVTFGKYLITHGDIINVARPDDRNGGKDRMNDMTTIIGHEHPAVRLYSKTRYEEYKAFLVSKNLIVLPSFNTIIEGHDIVREKNISPYLMMLPMEKFEDIETYLVSKDEDEFEVRSFGRIKDIISSQKQHLS